MHNKTIKLLNLNLKSVLKHKLQNEKLECQLRSTDRCLSDEIADLKYETDLLLDQLEELTKNISEMKSHVANIEICHVSEQYKIKLQVESLNEHTDGYKNISAQEHILRCREEQFEEYVEAEELKKKQLEINEKQEKKALEMENECESLESECNVLKKRNKAIMLQLRRKLLETDEIRRNLMKNKNMPTD